MTVAYRNSSGVVQGSSTGPIAITNNISGLANGDMMIAHIFLLSGTITGAPSGWTLLDTATAALGVGKTYSYWKLASSEGASWSWTISTTSPWVGYVDAFSGSGTLGIELHGGTNTGTTGNPNTVIPAFSPTKPKTMLWGAVFAYKGTNGHTYTPPTSFTEAKDSGDTQSSGQLTSFYLFQTASGTTGTITSVSDTNNGFNNVNNYLYANVYDADSVNAETATAASAVPKLTSAAVAKEVQKASAASSVPKLTSSGAVHNAAFSAPGASSLPKLTSAAIAKQIQKAAAASTLPKLTSAAVTKQIQKAAAASTIPKLTSASTVHTAALIGVAASRLPKLVATATVLKGSGFYEPGLRVDIYSANVKIGRGPVLTILDFEQGGALDMIGDARIVFAADDPNVVLIVPDVELRVFRGGEGFIGDYDVLETEVSVNDKNEALLTCTLQSVEGRIARYDTGLGLLLNASAPSGVVTNLLSGTGFSAGTVDSSLVTLTRPHDADSDWTALIDDAVPFGFHVRANVLGSPTAPTRTIDFGDFGADSGIVLGQGGYPLSIVKAKKTRAKVNHIIPIGIGDGYPMLTLKAATRGALLLTDPNFETSVAAWTAGGGTPSRIAGGYYNRWQMQLSATGGIAASQVSSDLALTGTTTGRKIRIQGRIQGVGATIGKTGRIRLTSFGGVGSETSTSTIVLTAAHQLVDVELTLGAARTAVTVNLSVDLYGGQAAADKVNFSRIIPWESLDINGVSHPYPVESMYSLGGQLTWFICDAALEQTNGALNEYLEFKGDYPIVASKAGWQATCDTMYGAASEYLTLNKVSLASYEAKPIGLKLVNSSGTQLVKPGDKMRLRYRGVTDDNSNMYLNVDQLLWNMGWRRRHGKDGSDDWTLTLNSIDAHYQDAIAKLAKLLTAWRGNLTTLKQNNYTFTVTQTGTLGSAGSPSITSVVLAPKLVNLLAVQKVNFSIRQTGGVTRNLDPFLAFSSAAAQAVWTSIVTLGTNVDASGDGVNYDVTQYYQQAPTPVPWPDYSASRGDVTAVIALNSIAAGPFLYQTALQFEATKIPLTPT